MSFKFYDETILFEFVISEAGSLLLKSDFFNSTHVLDEVLSTAWTIIDIKIRSDTLGSTFNSQKVFNKNKRSSTRLKHNKEWRRNSREEASLLCKKNE